MIFYQKMACFSKLTNLFPPTKNVCQTHSNDWLESFNRIQMTKSSQKLILWKCCWDTLKSFTKLEVMLFNMTGVIFMSGLIFINYVLQAAFRKQLFFRKELKDINYISFRPFCTSCVLEGYLEFTKDIIPSRVSGRGYKIGPVCPSVCLSVCVSVS